VYYPLEGAVLHGDTLSVCLSVGLYVCPDDYAHMFRPCRPVANHSEVLNLYSSFTMYAKNEIRVILSMLYSHQSIGMKFSMCYPIKRIHNLPPHLSYVSTLPDITQQPKRDIDELKHWHLGPYSSGHHQQSHWPVANKAACTHKGKGTSLRTPTYLATQPALFRATHIIESKTT